MTSLVPPPSVLVTGAAGFIGRNVARKLQQVGYRVTGLDIREDLNRIATAGGFQPWREDFASPDTLAAVRSGRFDAVVHHAALVDTTCDDYLLLRRINCDYPLLLADAARQAGVKLVYASSFSVYGQMQRFTSISEKQLATPACSGPLNPYAESKLAFDNALVNRYGISDEWRWLGLRYTNVFGGDEVDKGHMASMLFRILAAASRGQNLTLFRGTLRAGRDYVPVSAVAQCIVTALLNPGVSGVYNIGSGVAITFSKMVAWARTFRSGQRIAVRMVAHPFPERYQFWTCADCQKWCSVFGDYPLTCTMDEFRDIARALYSQLLHQP